jgi:glycosyltransferase involved in cell wall biosynthesis
MKNQNQSMRKAVDATPPVASTTKIRVLFVAHDAQLHGAQLTLLSILRNLDRSTFTPFVVVTQSGPFSEEVSRMAIPVWSGLVMRWVFRRNHVGLKSVLGAPWRLLRSPAIFALFLGGFPIRLGRLLQLIHDQRIDVVYTNTITVVDGAIAAKILRKPHIWHLHENIETNKGLLKVLPARYVATSLTLKLSTRIAVPSRALSNQIFGNQLQLQKVEVVHNGVDTNLFTPGPPSFLLHQQFDIPTDAPLVGICGAIQEAKGHDIFVKAAAEVSRRFPSAHFVVIGDGLPEYLRYIAQLAKGLGISNKLHYTGWRSDVSELLRELQVIVIASKEEAFGLTAIEGMASGIPVISTRCGGPEEVIEHGESGYFAQRGDYVEIAKWIVDLLSSDGLRKRMGNSGRDRTKQQFSVDGFSEKVEKTIKGAQSASTKCNE